MPTTNRVELGERTNAYALRERSEAEALDHLRRLPGTEARPSAEDAQRGWWHGHRAPIIRAAAGTLVVAVVIALYVLVVAQLAYPVTWGGGGPFGG